MKNMTDKELIIGAHFDNLRAAGGISNDAAHDIGYGTYEDTLEALKRIDAKPETVRAIGQFICGDCAEVVPCAHVGVTKAGKHYAKGY